MGDLQDYRQPFVPAPGPPSSHDIPAFDGTGHGFNSN